MIIANVSNVGNDMVLINVFDNVTEDFFGMGITRIKDISFDESTGLLTTGGLIYNNVDCMVFNV